VATESIGQVIRFDDEMADRFIRAARCAEADPPPPSKHSIKWADPKEVAAQLERKYAHEG
jgi:hypothetical protein